VFRLSILIYLIFHLSIPPTIPLVLSRAVHRRIYSFFTALRAPSFLINIPIYTTFHPNNLFKPQHIHTESGSGHYDPSKEDDINTQEPQQCVQSLLSINDRDRNPKQKPRCARVAMRQGRRKSRKEWKIWRGLTRGLFRL
jgi:hypothetical protein